MKYADGPTVEVQIRIDAAPALVWGIVSDITTPAKFSTELQRVRWINEHQFVGHNHHPAIGEWETTCTVTTAEPQHCFGWVVGDPANPSAEWRFTLQPDGTGTLLRQWMRIGPAPSGLTPAIEARPDKEERIIAHRLAEHRDNMHATIDGIKQLVETG